MLGQHIHARVIYGMGAPCAAVLRRKKVEGSSVRELIKEVVGSPQPNEPARRAASVLAEAMGSGRALNVEVADGADSETAMGQPVSLDDVVLLKGPDPAHGPKEVTVRASEPWVGGQLVQQG